MGRRALREGVNGGEWVLEEGGRWIGGWERWLVKECVGGSVGGVVLVQELMWNVVLRV